MPWVDYFSYEFAAYVLIFIITLFHKKRFEENKPIGFLFHATWAGAYAVPIIMACWLENNWIKLGGILTLERFVAYNITLNGLRHKGMFYLGESKYASWWDDIENLWKKSYPVFWVLFALAFFYLQFKL